MKLLSKTRLFGIFSIGTLCFFGWLYAHQDRSLAKEKEVVSTKPLPAGPKFTIAESGDSREDLRRLEEKLYARLENPQILDSRLIAYLASEQFVQPLIDRIHNDHAKMPLAKLLLPYNLPEADAAVKQYRHRSETPPARGCTRYTYHLNDIYVSYTSMTDKARGRLTIYDRLQTVQEHPHQKQDPAFLKAALQGGIWLPDFLDQQAWDVMGRQNRERFLQAVIDFFYVHFYVGRGYLTQIIAHSYTQGDADPVLAALALHMLGNHDGAATLEQYLQEQLHALETKDLLDLPSNISRLLFHPLPQWQDTLEQWAHFSDPFLSKEGWEGLAFLDTVESIETLSQYQPIIDDPYHIADLFTAMGSHKNSPHRLQWLKLLDRLVGTLPISEAYTASAIEAYESLTGKDFGANGLILPIGFQEEVANETLQKARGWVQAQKIQ